MQTEAQAREKWCPMVLPEACCIGSLCMMWRWAEGTRVVWKDTLEPVPPRTLYTRDTVIEETVSDRGYCGLAGRPA